MRGSLALVAAALLGSACAEPVAAPANPPGVNAAPQLVAYPPHVLTWQAGPPSLLLDSGGEAATGVAHVPAEAGANVIPLESYEATVRVSNYRLSRLGIDYAGARGRGRRPFLRLTIPPGSLDHWPDGRPFGPWDWVDVAVRVDPTELALHFAPGGLRFIPACQVVLELWYGGAGGDYDGDGDVDADDARLEWSLQLWHQVEPGGPWEPLPAYHSVRGHYFLARICGFSSYAVSF